MTDPVAALCARHHYPDALRDALGRLVEAAREAYPDLESFVLSGSGATGDYVHTTDGPATVLVSDLDMMLFTDRIGAKPERLAETVSELEAEHPSPLFSIDIAINPRRALERIPPRYQMAEIREAGVVLAGRDVRDRFPTTFDAGAARGSFLNNLWKPFLYWMPADQGFDRVYTQVCARLFLDVPLLATAEQGQCIPGHRARAETYLADPRRDGLYGEALRARVLWALEERRNPGDARAGLETAVAGFVREVIGALDGGATFSQDPDRASAARLARWLPARTVRRFGSELRSVVRDPRSPVRDLGWLVRKKEASAAAALVGLLQHLGSVDSPALQFDPPGGTRARLADFARTPEVAKHASETPLDFLFRCKRIYRDGLTDLFPSLAGKSTRQEIFLRSPHA